MSAAGWATRNDAMCRNGLHAWIPENQHVERGKVRCHLCKLERLARRRHAMRAKDPVANGSVPQQHWRQRDLVHEFHVLGLPRPQAAAKLGVTFWALERALARVK